MSNSFAQKISKKVLFIGNSYTSVNNLPQMIADVANSLGDALTVDSNTPGGQTLKQHFSNSTTLSKISTGNFDFVVLQEQSQYPAFPIGQVEADVFPYAHALDSIINKYNSCAETVFYMTWGRKNGDAANCPNYSPLCTYRGMDSLLNLRYRIMANDNNAILSPVGAVWKFLRENYPAIDLYQADESHPSAAGTYAAACCFYTTLFRKDPTLITFNSSLSAADAATIKNAVKTVVFNNLTEWNIGKFDPVAVFTYNNASAMQFNFVNNSKNATSYLWNFGDGNTSTQANPSYTYSNSGAFTAKLYASNCNITDSLKKTITIETVNIYNNTNSNNFGLYPNPTNNFITLYFIENSCSTEYKIYDFTGRTISTGKFYLQNETLIDVSNFSKGVYLLQVNSGEKSRTLKFIKN